MTDSEKKTVSHGRLSQDPSVQFNPAALGRSADPNLFGSDQSIQNAAKANDVPARDTGQAQTRFSGNPAKGFREEEK